MLIRFLFASGLAFFAAACATAETVETDCRDMPCVAIGDTFEAGPATITPLELLEDSRCPIEAECIHEGFLRVRALVERGGREKEIELNWHEPVPALSGMVELTAVWPDMSVQTMPLPVEAYRFHFTWTQTIADPTPTSVQ